jgi:hypothetical protein
VTKVQHRFSFIEVKWRGAEHRLLKEKIQECTPYCCKNGVFFVVFAYFTFLHKNLVNDLEIYIGKYIHRLSKVDFQIGIQG